MRFILSGHRHTSGKEDLSCNPLTVFSGWRKLLVRKNRKPNEAETSALTNKTLIPAESSQDSSATSIEEKPEPLTISEAGEDDPGVLAVATQVLAIIARYKLPGRDEATSKLNEKVFLAQIKTQISRSEPIKMCLPAFPFKSPNTTSKVLGSLPDKADEIALAHLNGLCATIARIYEPGAILMIISDGLVYNDLLGVPDKAVWAYGEALRTIAVQDNLKHIKFSRLQDLAKVEVPERLNEIAYISNATNFRHALLSQHGDPLFDASTRIHDDNNTCLTYRGYLKFLSTDLQDVYPIGPQRSKAQYKKGIEYIAKQMLFRGDAFAKAVRETFPDYVRLSIHPSSMEKKISISVLPTETALTTSWHCCIAFRLDGTTTTGHRSQFDADERFELVYKNGRPSFYMEKTDLLSWGQQAGGVSCEPMYPAGLMLRPAAGPNALSIEDIPGDKIRALAQHNSPVTLRGFANTRNRDLFIEKAHDLGAPTAWKFGLILEVKDQGSDTRGLNNVLSAEWMPYHYDGLFKTEKQTLPDGSEQLVSTPPRFQFFTSVTPSPKDTGFTLFSTSTMVFKYMPQYNLPPLEQLRKLTWRVSTSSFNATVLGNLPLVVDHPVTGQPCLRFHEPWPSSKTRFEATNVEIENIGEIEGEWDSEGICNALTELMHDRRVALYYSWEQGDLLVSDNTLALHTRSDFTAGSDRELWRIHFD